MIDVDDDHLGGAPCRAAGLDRAGGAVADSQKAHQPRGAAAAGKRLAFATDLREIRAGPGAVFEEPRLAYPEVHDAALVDEVVGDRLDEAGMRLRVLVGAVGSAQLAGLVVDEIVALRRAVDAVGPMKAGVEPLRRVWRADLPGEHQADLVVKRRGVVLCVEIAALPAPIGPGPGHAVEDLAGASFTAVTGALGQRRDSRLIGGAPPQPGRKALLRNRRQTRGHTGLAEVFLREDVGSDLAPFGRHLESLGLEDDRPVGVPDLAGGGAERHGLIRIPTGRGKMARDVHSSPPTSLPDVVARLAPATKSSQLRWVLAINFCGPADRSTQYVAGRQRFTAGPKGCDNTGREARHGWSDDARHAFVDLVARRIGRHRHLRQPLLPRAR